MRNLDKKLALIDCHIKFALQEVAIEMVGSKTDTFGNTKLTSCGVAKQSFLIQKEGPTIALNMFGVTLGTYNSFEEIYKFLIKTKNTGAKVAARVKKQLDEEEHIQAMKEALEKAKANPNIQGSRSRASSQQSNQDGLRDSDVDFHRMNQQFQ